MDEDLAEAIEDAVRSSFGDERAGRDHRRARRQFLRRLRLLLDQLPPDWTLNDLREMLS